MAVRTRVLVAATYAANQTDLIVFTVPAGRTAIVRSVLASVNNGLNPTIIVSMVRPSVTPNPYQSLVSASGQSTGLLERSNLWSVLEPGDQLRLTLSGVIPGAQAAHLWVSGPLLEGAPS